MIAGEQIAREATAYLAAVDACREAGYDPHAAARARSRPPTDDPTRYSEAAWRQHERRAERFGLT